MNAVIMKTMKVFDCQDMPADVRKEFFDNSEANQNDCYVSFDTEERECSVTKWLMENGAEKDEEVLINHWW